LLIDIFGFGLVESVLKKLIFHLKLYRNQVHIYKYDLFEM
jgi:hypothetical protein